MELRHEDCIGHTVPVDQISTTRDCPQLTIVVYLAVRMRSVALGGSVERGCPAEEFEGRVT
eukprot:1320136-Rhodomonas_salina.1